MKRFPLTLVLILCFYASVAGAQQEGSAQHRGSAGDVSSGSQQIDKDKSATDPKDSNTKDGGDGGYIDPNEPLFNPGPLPKGTVSLIGGTVENFDRIRNRMKVKIIGGKSVTVSFDERTSFSRDGQLVTYEKIKKGDRVYVDTMLNRDRVFARNVRIQSQLGNVDARGQILAYDPQNGEMTLRDDLSSESVSLHVVNTTTVRAPDGPARLSDLVPGALVAVVFFPVQGQLGQVKEITVLARPGSIVLFAGKVTHIDISVGTFSVANTTDNKTYDISFDPASTPGLANLTVGSDVTVRATFSGKKYLAQEVQIHRAQAQAVEP